MRYRGVWCMECAVQYIMIRVDVEALAADRCNALWRICRRRQSTANTLRHSNHPELCRLYSYSLRKLWPRICILYSCCIRFRPPNYSS